MARNTSVSLGEHFTEFIDEQVESGRYASASDVVRAGLRLLEREEKELASIRARLAEAEEDIKSGRVYEVNGDFWKELDREVEERIKRKDRQDAHALP